MVDVPSAPLNVSVTTVATGQVLVTWGPPISNGGHSVLFYNITTTNNNTEKHLTTSTNNITVDGLASNVNHTISVAAANCVGTGLSTGITYYYEYPFLNNGSIVMSKSDTTSLSSEHANMIITSAVISSSTTLLGRVSR